MKKTANIDAVIDDLADLIALYEKRAQVDPDRKLYYDAAAAGVRAAIQAVHKRK